MTWDDVVAQALELPEVEVGTAYDTPALRVRGKFLGRLREDGATLAVRCDIDERPLLVEKHDELYVTPHYEDYPMVLVALPNADPSLVRELVEDAWAERAPKRVVQAWLATAEGEAP
ncbi:MAG: MmcQ/YjbR family DNA-binding protein [Gaiellaceae bacterium]